MSSLRRALSSSVGTKLLIGLTGLLLFAYVLLHLAGNLLIFAGRETFNHYSHALISNPLVVPAEIGLIAVFLVHIYKTVGMWLRNRAARPIGYEKKTWAGHTSRKSLASATMIWTGLLTLLFVGVHLQQFKFGVWYEVGEPPIRDLYRTEAEIFRSPIWVGVYVLCMVLVGLHLRHGIASAFQSLGVDHPTYTKRIVAVGTVAAIAIAGAFAVIPVWVYLTQ
jgi:succinate dehydrogenase / fumarate reductase, cytochrome b subunit